MFGQFPFTILTVFAALTSSATLVTNVSELAALSGQELKSHRTFDIRGLITYGRAACILDDGTARILVHCEREILQPGDYVRLTGITDLYSTGERIFLVRTATVIGSEKLPVALAIPLSDVCRPEHHFRLVKTRGRVIDAFRDEIDRGYVYLTIRDKDAKATVTVHTGEEHARRISDLEGAEISVRGAIIPGRVSLRFFMGPIIRTETADIEILTPPSDDPSAFPEVSGHSNLSPSDIRALGLRRLSGRVLATWGDSHLLIRTTDGCCHRIDLAKGRSLPNCNDLVTVGGIAETDLYLLNLSHATCRRDGRATPSTEEGESVSPAAILSDEQGRAQINPRYYGKLIRLRGTVTEPLPTASNGGRLLLRSDSYVIPVDISSCTGNCPPLEPEMQVEATGICLMDVENWRADDDLPKIRGILLVVRSPQDLRILARPSWWTPGRLKLAIGSLLLALVGIFIWNRTLNRLVVRRSHDLLREQVAHISADLKVDERTRLAIELHDSLSQNLAGLACQVVAAKNAVGTDALPRQLDTVERMLFSSRTELKRCLSDLRGTALDDKDMTSAVTKTVLPVMGDAVLSVRFNVPRSRLLDSTSHSILCIVRELAANAVHHGKARHVRIAGECHGGTISFSVRDDGTGFDTANCPGLSEGHFGLEGIRERVERLRGTFAIRSSPGKGTRADITLSLPRTTDDTET